MLCRVLPYLEQTADYNSINFNVGVRGDHPGPALERPSRWTRALGGDWGRINATANITYVSAFLCPSDPNNGGNNAFFINGGRKLICTTDYYWNVGTARFFTGGIVNGPSYSPGATDNSQLGGAPCANKVITIAELHRRDEQHRRDERVGPEQLGPQADGLGMVYAGPTWNQFVGQGGPANPPDWLAAQACQICGQAEPGLLVEG